jgi:hypothetical protein
MKFLDYIIFHFFEFQKKVGNSDISTISTSIFFTIMIWMNILTLGNFSLMKNSYPTKNFVIPVILFCVVIFSIIYFYLKKKRYADYNFTPSFLGYFYLLLYLTISFILFIYSVQILKTR